MISVSAVICAGKMCVDKICLFSRQRGIIFFFNVCRVEYNMNLQVTTWPNSSDFLISPDLLKIARLDIFFLKVSGKAYLVAFRSTSSKNLIL